MHEGLGTRTLTQPPHLSRASGHALWYSDSAGPQPWYFRTPGHLLRRRHSLAASAASSSRSQPRLGQAARTAIVSHEEGPGQGCLQVRQVPRALPGLPLSHSQLCFLLEWLPPQVGSGWATAGHMVSRRRNQPLLSLFLGARSALLEALQANSLARTGWCDSLTETLLRWSQTYVCSSVDVGKSGISTLGHVGQAEASPGKSS